MKQLKTCLEKETSDVMRQLNLVRRSEVKALSLVHRDRDELVRYNAIYLNGDKNCVLRFVCVCYKTYHNPCWTKVMEKQVKCPKSFESGNWLSKN